jgi:hypothetical protein
MEIERGDLEDAVRKGILSGEQAERLWTALEKQHTSSSTVSWFAPVVYYGGALIVIIAMCWFMLRVAEAYGYVSLTLTALAYGGIFAGAGALLRARRELRVASGLLFALVVAMVPVAVYGLEQGTNLWKGVHRIGQLVGLLPDPAAYDLARPELYASLRSNTFLEELSALVAGLVALRYVRFPFLTAPIAFALWAMATVSVPDLLFDDTAWEAQLWLSSGVGAVILVGTYFIDRRTEQDYAFWTYLFGLMAFWGGLSMMKTGTEWEYLAYCMVNLLLVLLGIFLERRMFLVFGALGIFQYLYHLAYVVFADSIFFPIALSILGAGLIYLGVKYQQNRAVVDRFVWTRLPSALRRLSPRRR